jgi:hypothetical protein
MDITTAALLTINSGGSLTVAPDIATSARGINIFFKGTLINNGALTISTNTNVTLIVMNDSTTFNNSGTVVLNTPYFNILVGGPGIILNNAASGILNFQRGRGFHCSGSTGNTITNQGTMNHLGSDFFAALNPGYTFNNSGTINVKSGQGIALQGGTVNNLACGKIFMSAGDYDNSALSTTNNAGLMVLGGVNNTGGTFNNTGVTNRLPSVGTLTNTGNGAVSVRSNIYPIFAYSPTFNGTVNGIFTDSLATISAGTFAAPFTFTPLATLPRGIQTLYAKITSGTCNYIVPFSYNTLTSSVSKLDAEALGLQQNRPNPFSQQTTIAFTLPETTKAVLTVYDITGRQVFTSNNDSKMGYNEVILNKSVFQNTGTYFYRLTTDKHSTVKKLQFIAE